MGKALLARLAWLVLPLTAAGQELGDVPSALRQLRSPSANERRLAERWLAAHLTPADYPEVVASAAGESVEVRERLAGALSSDDAHLELAALLSSDSNEALRQLGGEALARSLARWYEAAEAEAWPPELVETTLRGRFRGWRALRIEDESLETLLDRIDRLTDSRVETVLGAERAERSSGDPVAIVLDPDWSAPRAGVPAAIPTTILGAWDALVLGTAQSFHARVELYGWRGPHPWVWIGPADAPGVAGARGSAAGPARDGFQRILGWIREIAQPRQDVARASAAARALAATGWPAAIGWLERRWAAHQDAAALDGLVLAAGRGRVAPALAGREGLRVLLERAEAAPAAERARWVRAACALGAVGNQGEDLRALLADGFERKSALAQRLSTDVLAAWGSAPQSVREEWSRWLSASGSGRVPLELRLTALRALAATSASADLPLELAEATALLEASAARGRAADVLAWVRRLNVREPAEWSDPGPFDAALRLELLEHWLARAGEDAPAVAARFVLRLLSELPGGEGEERIGDALGKAVARSNGGQVDSALAKAASAGPGRGSALVFARLALLAGRTRHVSAKELLADLETRAQWTSSDWQAAGALAAFPKGPVADQVVERMAAHLAPVLEALAADRADAEAVRLDAGWVRGWERALNDLRSQGEDERAEKLLQYLRRTVGKSQHPLRRELSAARWPPPPRRDALALEEPGAWIQELSAGASRGGR
jgi:hypothetical protein